jgi:hypothetical protein
MELLFKAEDILSYNKLMEWDKNDLSLLYTQLHLC